MWAREAHPKLFVSMKVVSDDTTQKEAQESESCWYWEQDRILDLGTQTLIIFKTTGSNIELSVTPRDWVCAPTWNCHLVSVVINVLSKPANSQCEPHVSTASSPPWDKDTGTLFSAFGHQLSSALDSVQRDFISLPKRMVATISSVSPSLKLWRYKTYISLLTEAGSKLGLAPEEHSTLAPVISSATSTNARPIGFMELQSQGMLAVAIHVTLGMLTPSKSSQEEKNSHTLRPCRGFKGDLQLPRATGLLMSERGLCWKETRKRKIHGLQKCTWPTVSIFLNQSPLKIERKGKKYYSLWFPQALGVQVKENPPNLLTFARVSRGWGAGIVAFESCVAPNSWALPGTSDIFFQTCHFAATAGPVSFQY